MIKSSPIKSTIAEISKYRDTIKGCDLIKSAITENSEIKKLPEPQQIAANTIGKSDAINHEPSNTVKQKNVQSIIQIDSSDPDENHGVQYDKTDKSTENMNEGSLSASTQNPIADFYSEELNLSYEDVGRIEYAINSFRTKETMKTKCDKIKRAKESELIALKNKEKSTLRKMNEHHKTWTDAARSYFSLENSLPELRKKIRLANDSVQMLKLIF